MNTAITYAELRQFPAALKLYDRVLDITPSDVQARARKASIYQAQGNLPEAANLLSEINWQTPNSNIVHVKIIQLTFERNYYEAIRLLQARQAQFHFESEYDKATGQVELAFVQRLAGDIVGARVTAQPARNTLEQLHKDQPKDYFILIFLSEAYAVLGQKDLALETAERAIVTLGGGLDALSRRTVQEHVAAIQTMVGENSRAIASLAELLQKPYWSYFYGPAAITSAHLKLDPIWDPLRGDPAFQKICEEKQQ